MDALLVCPRLVSLLASVWILGPAAATGTKVYVPTAAILLLHRTNMCKGWGTGFGNKSGAMISMYCFAVSNMVLDTIIFAIPMAVYLRPGTSRRQILALGALFTLGSVYVKVCCQENTH